MCQPLKGGVRVCCELEFVFRDVSETAGRMLYTVYEVVDMLEREIFTLMCIAKTCYFMLKLSVNVQLK